VGRVENNPVEAPIRMASGCSRSSPLRDSHFECFYEKVIKVKADVAAFPYVFILTSGSTEIDLLLSKFPQDVLADATPFAVLLSAL
jgi:hypothetical protein